MEKLTNETFKEKIFDYTKVNESTENTDIEFKNEKPVLIDFFANYCLPCKTVSPILEELAKEYEGKLDIYKVDTEEQQELSAAFGIRSIPSFLFIPTDGGQPQMAQGALPKETFESAIKDVLKVEK